LELTLAYAVACGGEARYWQTRWREAALGQQADRAARSERADEADGARPPTDEQVRRAGADVTEAPDLAATPSGARRRAAVPVAAIALAVGAALTAIRLAAARSRPGRGRGRRARLTPPVRG
jgi:hypothetical protein